MQNEENPRFTVADFRHSLKNCLLRFAQSLRLFLASAVFSAVSCLALCPAYALRKRRAPPKTLQKSSVPSSFQASCITPNALPFLMSHVVKRISKGIHQVVVLIERQVGLIFIPTISRQLGKGVFAKR
jgi:hypothetical protein